MKLYGSLNNRLEENHTFCDEITVGTGMTEYFWSDRHAYEVIAVKDQKHVTVRELDHIHVGDGCMDNSWKLVSNENNRVRNMVKRGKYWYDEVIITKDLLDIDRDTNDSFRFSMFLAQNNIDPEVLRQKGTIKRYHKANVSFGIANYYYDYEF